MIGGGHSSSLLRRARIRGLAEGQVQTARSEALSNDAKDECERWQDYGFAARPIDGEGLVINAGGSTIVLRMDRIADRPRLAAYEVSVWHKDGARVTLRAGRVVEIDCDQLLLRADTSITLDAPTTTVTQPSLVLAGLQLHGHRHSGVQSGGLNSGPPV